MDQPLPPAVYRGLETAYHALSEQALQAVGVQAAPLRGFVQSQVGAYRLLTNSLFG